MIAAVIALCSLILAAADTGQPACDLDLSVATPARSATTGSASAVGVVFHFKMHPTAGKKVTKDALDAAGEVLEKRLNPSGKKNIKVAGTDDDRIEVTVPGMGALEAEAIRTVLIRPGKLEFRLLGPDGTEPSKGDDKGVKAGYSRMHYLDESKLDGDLSKSKSGTFIWVKDSAEISRKSVQYAGASLTPGSTNFNIQVELLEEFENQMRALTKAQLGKPLAIVVDGEVISAPTIQAEFGGNFQITGNFTEVEAVALSSHLMNPLEIPSIVEKITVLSPAAGK